MWEQFVMEGMLSGFEKPGTNLYRNSWTTFVYIHVWATLILAAYFI